MGPIVYITYFNYIFIIDPPIAPLATAPQPHLVCGTRALHRGRDSGYKVINLVITFLYLAIDIIVIAAE